jgi:hypothetical protein
MKSGHEIERSRALVNVSPRWYGAAGASLVAAAVTARYVRKWRRRRTLRQGQGDRARGGGRYFIGLDLTDPTARNRRACDVAVLDSELYCTFDQWNYKEDGSGIVPSRALGRSFILAVDGPQGLAGDPDATMRESERLVNAPGHTPYTLPTDGRPYAGFIAGSVKLFHRLVTSGSRFRLLGMDGAPAADANLLEVFPGGAWRKVADTPLPPKRTLDGREARFELLHALDVTFESEELPTDDQLDAAMAAWVAYRFNEGAARAEGRAPEYDQEAGAIREGYVVQPIIGEEASEDADAVAPV